MSHLTGFYKSLSTGKYLDFENDSIVVTSSKPETKLRPNKEFWLSIDDGKLGKYGDPVQLNAVVEGNTYRLWVEPRGPAKYGIIPTNAAGDYSNTFLSISDEGDLSIQDDWRTSEEFVIERE